MITVCPYQLQCTNFTKCCGVALTKCFSSTFSFGKNDKSEIHKKYAHLHIIYFISTYLHAVEQFQRSWTDNLFQNYIYFLQTV